MKFLEWWIFTTGILCVLSADSSIGWCAVLAIACLFGIIMRQFADDFSEDARRCRKISKALKSSGFYYVENCQEACGDILIAENEEWVRRCESEPTPEEVTIWEEYQ